MSNSDFLATAFVEIRPKTTGFQKSLRTQIKDAIAPIKPTINVAPTTKGFQSSLRVQVADAIKKVGIFKVPVEPVLGPFRAKLAKDLSQKPIPVSVISAGASGTGGAGGAARAQLTVEEQRVRVQQDLKDAEKLHQQALRDGLTDRQRDILLSQAQTKARRAFLDVTDLQQRSERTLREERLRLRTIKVGSKIEAAIDEPARAAESAAATRKAADEETAATDELKKQRESLAKVGDKLIVSESNIRDTMKSTLTPAEKLTSVTRELGKAKDVQSSLSAELNAALRNENTERAKGLRNLINQSQATINLGEDKKAELQSSLASSKIKQTEGELSKKLAESLKVEVSSLTTLAAVREQDNALSSTSRKLKTLETAATKENQVATVSWVQEKQTEITVRREALAAQSAAIKQNQKESTSQKNLARGAGATGLSFLGVRGATLAAGSAFLIGAAAVASFAKAVRSAASLETELNVFKVTAEATATELERVRSTAVALGADITLPGVSAGDAAESMSALAKAGLNVKDSIDGARGVLQLATAAQISNAESTELVASALNAFSLAGIEATHVADLLAGASIAAQGSISDMGIALQQSSAVARQANLGLDDTVSFITLLAKAGIRGSDAGTAIRTAILRLIAPTKEASKELGKLGVTIFDVQGNFRPQVFSDINDALSDLNQTARNQVLRKIFGQDAIRFAVVAGRAGTKGLEDIREEITRSGLAARLAEARTKGFAGSLLALRNSFEQVGIAIGKSVIPTLEPVIKSLTLTTGGLGTALNKIGPELVAAGAAFALFRSRAFGLLGVLETLILNLRTMPGGITALRASLLSAATSFNAIAIAVAAAVAGIVFLATRETEAEKATKKLAETTDALALAMNEASAATKILGAAQKALPTARRGVTQAEKDVDVARRALAASDASEGSARRSQLEINLTIALRKQERALGELKAAEDEVNLAREDSIAASRRKARAINTEEDSVNKLIEAQKRAAAIAGGGSPADNIGAKTQSALKFEVIGATEALKDQIRVGEVSSDRFVRDFAKRQRAIVLFMQLLNRVPTHAEVEILLNEKDFMAALRRLVGLGDIKTVIKPVGDAIGDTIINAAKQKLVDRANELLDALKGALAKGAVKQSLIQEQIDIIEIKGGSPQEQLAKVREAIAEQEAIVAKVLAAEAAKRKAGQTTGLDTLRKQRQEARSELRSLTDQERQLEDQIKGDAEKAVNDLEKKRQDRAKAILKIFSAKEQKQLNRVAIAEQTKSLKDDIITNSKLVEIYNHQKAVARKKIKDKEALEEFLLSTDQKIFTLTLEIQNDRKDLQQQLKEEQRNAREKIVTGLELDIEFAQITENRGREVALRKKLIKALQDQIKHEKGNTNKIKELRNEIARQRQAIKEATDEQNKKNQARDAFNFSFLQTQAGFAANLLGNLIPLGATGGLVGGTSGKNTSVFPTVPENTSTSSDSAIGIDPLTGRPLRESGGQRSPADSLRTSAGTAAGGPSRGGQNVEIHLLRQILRTLHDIYRGTGHPEAHHRRRTNANAMDFQGGV